MKCNPYTVEGKRIGVKGTRSQIDIIMQNNYYIIFIFIIFIIIHYNSLYRHSDSTFLIAPKLNNNVELDGQL